MAETQSVKKVMAWLIPQNGMDAVPVCEEPVTFGYNPIKNDVCLDSFLADISQASVRFEKPYLYLKNRSDNGMTRLDGVILHPDEEKKVEHEAVIDLAGTSYQAVLVDRIGLAEVIFRKEDGTNLMVSTCHIGDRIRFPEAPIKPADRKFSYRFTGWRAIEGKPADADRRCTGTVVYAPEYSREQVLYTCEFCADSSIFSSGSNVLRLNCGYGDPIPYPKASELQPASGLLFEGWTLTAGQTGEGDCCISNVKFQAKLKKQTFTCTFVAEAGFFSDNSMVRTVPCDSGARIPYPDSTDLKNPSSGTRFEGWKVVEGKAGSNGICVADVKFEAQYKQISTGGTMRMTDFLADKNQGSILPIQKMFAISIGSDPSCTVRDPQLPGICASIEGTGYVLTSFSDWGVTLNGQKITNGQKVELYNRDSLQIGSHDYNVILRDRERPTQKTAVLRNQLGAELPLQAGENRLGRMLQREFFQSVYVGSVHAAITVREDGCFLQDLDSTNGTYLCGRRVGPSEMIPLKSGDQIVFANVLCEFLLK